VFSETTGRLAWGLKEEIQNRETNDEGKPALETNLLIEPQKVYFTLSFFHEGSGPASTPANLPACSVASSRVGSGFRGRRISSGRGIVRAGLDM
jgi:hypothetical protein